MRILFVLMFVSSVAYGQKISDLPVASTLGGTEVVAGVQAGTTKKISVNQIQTFVDASYWKVTGTTTLTGNVTIDGTGFNLEFDADDLAIYTSGFQLETSGDDVDLSATGDIDFHTASGSTTAQFGVGGSAGFATGRVTLTDESGTSKIDIVSDSVLLNGVAGSDGEVPTIQANGSLGWGTGVAKSGTAVLIAGTLAVSNTTITANSRIFLTSNVDGGTPGFVRVSSRSVGASFTITSSNGADTSTVAWFIIEP